MRRALTFLLTAAIVIPLGACAREDQEKDELAAALYRTETLPRRFTFNGLTDFDVRVRGVIVDDYRYRADATVDGKPYLSEVVVDDARALRAGSKDVATSGLAVGTWVVDPKGANTLFDNVPRGQIVSGEPLFDSFEILKYVRRAVGESAGVVQFNPESQDYRPKFDPFPRPAPDEIRYDVATPTLAPRDPTAAAGASDLPGARYFRKLSVYVKDGRITAIRERISVEDALNDPRSRIAARMGDYNITLPADAPVKEQAAFLVETLNGSAQTLGRPPITVRDLVVTFEPLATSDEVTLPDGAKRGNLKNVFDHGQVLYERPG